MRAGIIIQARVKSTRLPGKVLLDLGGVTLLTRVIEQMALTNLPIVVATSDSPDDDLIEFDTLSNTAASVFRGSLHNVRNRFYLCALEHNFDVVVRVTADNPFSEPSFVTEALEQINYGAHYARAKPNLCPDGSNIEAFRFSELQISEENGLKTVNIHDAEHVTPEMIKRLSGSQKFNEFTPHTNLGLLGGDIHVGVDTLSDYVKIRKVYQMLGEVSGAETNLLERVVGLFKSNPELLKRGRRHEL